jgi:hypothetical protein
MIVTPPTDLVLDVLQSADPVTQRAATAKLEALRTPGADFGAELDSRAGETTSATGVTGDQSAKTADAGAVLGATGAASARVVNAPPSSDVYRKFEAFVLQVFVETMLPEQAQDIFGKGTAGGIWRSMLAEQLGNQLAQGKGIGIAKQLASAHPASDEDAREQKLGRADQS